MGDTVFDRASDDIRSFLTEAARGPRFEERVIADRAGQLLVAYAERIKAAPGVPPAAAGPARYAMAVLIDTKIRALPFIQKSAWTAAAHDRVYDRRDITVDDLRQFAETAAQQGAEFAELETFLRDRLNELERARHSRSGVARTPALLFTLAVMVYLIALGGYAAFLDYRYYADVRAAFDASVSALPEGRNPDRLSDIANLHAGAQGAIAVAPLRGIIADPPWSSAAAIDDVYAREAALILPDALREAMGEAMASEGQSIELYDTLRAWSVLTGRAEWAPHFLAGWVETRTERLGLGELARHVMVLPGPEPRLSVPDPALLAQAQSFAAEAPEAERAFLELTRLPAMRDLPRWRPGADIAEFDLVFVLRSGAPLGAGLPGTYTRAGWDAARAGAVDAAIDEARAQADLLLRGGGARPSPDTRTAVLAALQEHSLRAWRGWLEDLRVRPFSDPSSARAVSGALSRGTSPLKQIVEEVWLEAGGEDPTRPLRAKREIESLLGEAVAYVRSPRADELSMLFASLNVALSALGADADQGIDALMSLTQRAQSVAALKGAPPLVAQITEDVLAQASSTHAQVLMNPLTREWQAQIYPLCLRAVDGRFPFHAGKDVEMADFDAFFAKNGALNRYFRQYAERNLDMSAETWRWSTEARLTGLTPESAAFLQRALTISSMFYGADGFGTELTIVPLAQSAPSVIDLGGARVSVADNGGALSWPGPVPEAGMRVSFGGAQGNGLSEPGVWGFLRLLELTSIRRRDEGARHLVDLRFDGGTGSGGDSARIFFELRFPSPLNPVAAREILSGMTCPPVL